ncbi:MAG: cupin domain-containing protein [Bacteroidales bacterium]|nr:cupin domain-containing protein [Bacteroidales bacterium]
MKVRKPTTEEVNGVKDWGIWMKEPSEFRWFYDEDERCFILEGEAEVFDVKGNHISFGPGDWVEFEQGLECTWKIRKTI